MIRRYELEEYLGDFNIYQVEKDYLQHLVLWRVYAYSNDVVFKGGTALQKAYGLNRFSEDLDFTAIGSDGKTAGGSDVLPRVDEALKSVNNFYKSGYKEISGRESASFKLKVEGPLHKGPTSLCTIELDISFKESLLLQPKAMLITPIYKGLSPYFARVMEMDEILAEKVRALFTRNRVKARDLYDMYFILKKGGRFRISMIEKKLDYYKKPFSNKEFRERLGEAGKRWNDELKPLMKTVPDYDDVRGFVSGEMGKA